MIQSYSGNGAYCFSNSLRMCLEHTGMNEPPDPSFIECLAGMPFGTTFLKLDPPLFFPNPAAIDPNTALDQALKTVGWTCELWQGESVDEAEAALRDAIRYGPVLMGPLDMGFLSYDPQHRNKRGGDHFVVVLAIEGDKVRLHDPQLYPYAVLTMPELVRAWDARHLGYMEAAYTLRHSFYERSKPSRQELLETALAVAKDLQTKPFDGPIAYGGKQAFSLAAKVLRHDPSPPFTNLLVNFALPLGARRCSDGAAFLAEAGNVAAAAHLREKAKLFGHAQYDATRESWRETARLFDHLGEVEAQLIDRMS